MEDRNRTQQTDRMKGSCCGGVAPFFLGLVLSLILGWWIFPEVLYSEKVQPFPFNHVIHLEDAGLSCEDCHYLREDGSFSGTPSNMEGADENISTCNDCHSGDYDIPTEEEIDWIVYQKQPDNVFFSHAVHSMDNCGQCHDFEEVDLCGQCHLDVAQSEEPPVAEVNIITGYNRYTMKMWQCEGCHALSDHIDYRAMVGPDAEDEFLHQVCAENEALFLAAHDEGEDAGHGEDEGHEEDEGHGEVHHIVDVKDAGNGCQVCHK